MSRRSGLNAASFIAVPRFCGSCMTIVTCIELAGIEITIRTGASAITAAITAAVTTTTPSSIGETYYDAQVETSVFDSDSDVTIEKEGPYYLTRGAEGIFRIRVKNIGTGEARNITVTDELPSGTVFVSATAPAGSGFVAVFLNTVPA